MNRKFEPSDLQLQLLVSLLALMSRISAFESQQNVMKIIFALKNEFQCAVTIFSEHLWAPVNQYELFEQQ